MWKASRGGAWPGFGTKGPRECTNFHKLLFTLIFSHFFLVLSHFFSFFLLFFFLILFLFSHSFSLFLSSLLFTSLSPLCLVLVQTGSESVRIFINYYSLSPFLILSHVILILSHFLYVIKKMHNITENH
jgi:hypothetical protein